MAHTKTGPSNEKRLQDDVKTLLQGELDDNWQWVTSSTNTKDACKRQQKIYFKEFIPRKKW